MDVVRSGGQMIYSKTISMSKEAKWCSRKHRLWSAGDQTLVHHFLDVLLNLSFKKLIASFL